MIQTYNRDQTFSNLFIFSLLVETVLIVLFALLFFPRTHLALPFAWTIGGCLIIFIIWALIASSQADNTLREKKNGLNTSKFHNLACPDYFIRGEDNVCKNQYISTSKKTKYEFLDPKTKKPLQDVDVGKLFDNEYISTVCDDRMADQRFDNMPWTAVKPICRNINS